MVSSFKKYSKNAAMETKVGKREGAGLGTRVSVGKGWPLPYCSSDFLFVIKPGAGWKEGRVAQAPWLCPVSHGHVWRTGGDHEEAQVAPRVWPRPVHGTSQTQDLTGTGTRQPAASSSLVRGIPASQGQRPARRHRDCRDCAATLGNPGSTELQ